MKTPLLLFILAVLSWSCSKDEANDCGATGFPPAMLSLNLVDVNTGENFFASNPWAAKEITISDTASSEQVDFHIATVGINPLLVFQLPEQEGNYAYTFKRNGETIVTISFDVVNEEMQCYTKTSATNLQVSNTAVERSGNTVTILIG